MFLFSISKSVNHESSSDKKLSSNAPGSDDMLKRFFDSSPSTNSLLGDINGDGKVDSDDKKLLVNHVRKIGENHELTAAQKKAADLNNDGKIGEEDIDRIVQILRTQDFDSLKINPDKKGDLNSDGKIDRLDYVALIAVQYAQLGLVPDRTVSDDVFKACDLNSDGLVNGDDIDAFMELAQTKPTQGSSPPDPPSPPESVTGDINQDGITDYGDLQFLGDYLNGLIKTELTEAQIKAVDFNGDKEAGRGDLSKLQNMVYDNELMSIDPASKIQGDLNNDGKVDNKDLRALKTLRMVDPFDLPPEILSLADLDKDGMISLGDINHLRYDIMKMDKPKLEITSGANVDPKNHMISQNLGFTNPNEKYDGFNGNCGITSLLMAARIFGVIDGNTENAADQIIALRDFIGVDAYEGSTLRELSQAGKVLGLDATTTIGNLDYLKEQLTNGAKVILGVDPSKYAPAFSGGHAFLVTGFDVDRNVFIINDPGFQHSIRISAKALEAAMKPFGNEMLVLNNPNLSNTPSNTPANPPTSGAIRAHGVRNRA